MPDENLLCPGDEQPLKASPPDEHPELCIWECPNCGQSYFGETPPDMCEFCRDFTTWRRRRGEC